MPSLYVAWSAPKRECPGIVATRKATAADWDDAWRASRGVTYFQSREWATIWSRHAVEGDRPHPLHVTFEDGRTAVLPLSRRPGPHGLLPTWLLSPAGTFGGWLAPAELEDVHARQLTALLLGLHGRLRWRLSPYDPHLVRLRVTGAIEDDTHALDLRSGFEAIAAGWRKGQRSAIRRAERAGVEIREATSRSEWNGFIAAYEDSLRRWGDTATTRYPAGLFIDIFERCSPHVRMWVAIVEGEVAAGALCFYAGEHAVYWAGAAREEYLPLRPVNLLIRDAIRDACARNYRWFDFNPSGKLEGVQKFKRSFGAVPLSAPLVRSRTRSARLVELGLQITHRAR